MPPYASLENDLLEPILTGESPLVLDLALAKDPRLSRYPFWKNYKDQKKVMWAAEQIDWDDDAAGYRRLLPAERRPLNKTLAFFAGADALVLNNLDTNFIDEIKWDEVSMAYRFQAVMEDVHRETYSMAIEALASSMVGTVHPETYSSRGGAAAARTALRSTLDAEIKAEFETCQGIRRMREWVDGWTRRGEVPFAERLLGFLCTEGIFFSGPFGTVFWIESKNKCPGLVTSNRYISRDENLHCELAVLVYRALVFKVSRERIVEIFSSAVEAAQAFARECYPEDLEGVNARMMCGYVEFVADFWLEEMGERPIYGTAQPLPFIDKMALPRKTNFFELHNPEYTLEFQPTSKTRLAAKEPASPAAGPGKPALDRAESSASEFAPEDRHSVGSDRDSEGDGGSGTGGGASPRALPATVEERDSDMDEFGGKW